MYATEESDVEIDAVKEIFKAAIKKDDRHQHQVLTKLNKSPRDSARVLQFVSNCHINPLRAKPTK